MKKYHYYYWFAFPALCVPESVALKRSPQPITSRFNEVQVAITIEICLSRFAMLNNLIWLLLPLQINSLLSEYDSVCLNEHIGFFLINETDEQLSVFPLSQFDTVNEKPGKVTKLFWSSYLDRVFFTRLYIWVLKVFSVCKIYYNYLILNTEMALKAVVQELYSHIFYG